ncbi:MAG: AMP-binding protein, partial [Bdellovibrionales bacterium]|nr:AMP-binding protein [Bdellovibrionales bacterium]NQZ18578.1 AMP-binding protein [Bdellovibrionales bacterium]
RFSAPEADYVLNDSGAKLLFIDEEFLEVEKGLKFSKTVQSMNDLAKAVDTASTSSETYEFDGEYQEPCMILYTSGTTGFPKGVIITPKILFWNSINTSMSLGITQDDSMVSFLPLFHTGGWNVLLTPFSHRGATTVFIPKFDGEQILELCESEKVTILFGVPTTLGMMAGTELFEKVDLSSVRFAVVGGEPMSLNMIQKWHSKGVYIRQGFGLTECGPNCFSLSEKDAEEKIGSIGRPNFYVETRIIDENNKDVEVGAVGELLLRGPMCMESYWNQPDATQQSFFEGWLRTGDLVKKDDENYFYVVGRKKEMFISGGENVYPAEVEKVLSRHPAIEEVAVLGVKDPQWGEVGKAFVVSKQGLTPNEIINYCNGQIARFKIPKQFQFMDELPKGSTGKILKKELIEENRI